MTEPSSGKRTRDEWEDGSEDEWEDNVDDAAEEEEKGDEEADPPPPTPSVHADWELRVGETIASHGLSRRMRGVNGAIVRTAGKKHRDVLLANLGAAPNDHAQFSSRQHLETHRNMSMAVPDMLTRMKSMCVCMARDIPYMKGPKEFVVGRYTAFYEKLCTNGPAAKDDPRHYYEIFPCEPYELPVNIFMDIDFPCATEDDVTAYLEMEKTLVERFTTYLVEQLGVDREDVEANILDSSRRRDPPVYMKMSRHIIWKIKGVMMANVLSAGALVRAFELEVGQEWGQMKPEDDANPWYTPADGKFPAFLVDMATYTRGRNFRIVGSEKAGTSFVLMPVEVGCLVSPEDRARYCVTKADIDRFSVLYPPEAKKMSKNNSGIKEYQIRLVEAAQPFGPQMGDFKRSTNSLTEHWIGQEERNAAKAAAAYARDGGAPPARKKRATKRGGGVLDMLTKKRANSKVAEVNFTQLTPDICKEMKIAMSNLLIDLVAAMAIALRAMTHLSKTNTNLLMSKSKTLETIVGAQARRVSNHRPVDGMEGTYNTETKEVTTRHKLHVCPFRAFSSLEPSPCHKSENSYIRVKLEGNAVMTKWGCFGKDHADLLDSEKTSANDALQWTKRDWPSTVPVGALLRKLDGLEVEQPVMVSALYQYLDEEDEEELPTASAPAAAAAAQQ